MRQLFFYLPNQRYYFTLLLGLNNPSFNFYSTLTHSLTNSLGSIVLRAELVYSL